ncbi:hypothetical protein CO180_03595 [candidate division WWE3 bacterium CG_4_9_14_3_um_filter_41_6]|uniref:Uncharacterized protein n=1 Tax=candidate division WWE3 bacterium CG_4_10_14_0_2_um_filter_41_14 TaxID=1975072 RepID=A0A2M7THG0_UNCKA|nr:MAG: hypothetical protein COY32_04870 [candidate division WWE3 bacterium CG_4_10_14_0_2_um_filter_41_14]PJA38418.1 MAG: hypothetical protein CO180_03595 [candidate division WWE3 bacterium CG_4_9_14_3_um_filter_41_6]
MIHVKNYRAIIAVLVLSMLVSGCSGKKSPEATLQNTQQQPVQVVLQGAPELSQFQEQYAQSTGEFETVQTFTTEVIANGRRIVVTVNWVMPVLNWDLNTVRQQSGSIYGAINPSQNYTLWPGDQITVDYWGFVYYWADRWILSTDQSVITKGHYLYSSIDQAPQSAGVGYVSYRLTLQNKGGVVKYRRLDNDINPRQVKEILLDNPIKQSDIWSVGENSIGSDSFWFASTSTSNNDCVLHPLSAVHIVGVDLQTEAVTIRFNRNAESPLPPNSLWVDSPTPGMNLWLGSPPLWLRNVPNEYFARCK